MPKSVFSSLNGQKLELKVKKWEAEMRDSENLKISVLSCFLPFIMKIKEILNPQDKTLRDINLLQSCSSSYSV